MAFQDGFMSLSLQTRSVGEIAVIACAGPIVEGPNASALDSYVRELLPRSPHVLLDFRDVSFIDSAALGILVRLLARARAARGDLKLCAVSPHLRDVLRSTKLNTILKAYDADVDAIASFYTSADSAEAPASLDIDIVCVDSSPNVLAYLREVLSQAGYGVTTTPNVADARVLIRATRPKVVLMNSGIHSKLASEVSDRRVVELPEDFSTGDAGEAARHVLDRVAAAIKVRTEN
jgi:anti-sigma B factor antagonist